VRERVADALRTLASDPDRPGALRKLTNAPEWRLRIGSWRALILLNPEEHTIIVTRVLPRGRAYRD
jgi:mRNA-degrading endonuclease RelE of RelBE toxin-antitoxin system